MANRGQKDDLVDTVLAELSADQTLTNEQYDRAWKAFRRMTESELMLMKLILQKHLMQFHNEATTSRLAFDSSAVKRIVLHRFVALP